MRSHRAALARHLGDDQPTADVTDGQRDSPHPDLDDALNPLTRAFEEQRPRLERLAYRMLGSLSEAEDAVQETWLQLARADTESIDNVAGWLTTVTSRVCLDALRSRKVRGGEEPRAQLPDPVIFDDTDDLEAQRILADDIGLALLVVLETLAPAERLAFVLHDLFDLPFEEIASIVGRTVPATRQLASRARRRIQGRGSDNTTGLAEQRRIVEAFLTAARGGDITTLLSLLDPDVELRHERDGQVFHVQGAQTVATRAAFFSKLARSVKFMRINDGVGFVAWTDDGQPMSVMSFRIQGSRITEILALGDAERLERLKLPSSPVDG